MRKVPGKLDDAKRTCKIQIQSRLFIELVHQLFICFKHLFEIEEFYAQTNKQTKKLP